jgi:predicted alpha/beta-fold hydrolase
MDNILNDPNIGLYKDIANKIFGDDSYFYCLKVYNVINKFAELLPESILNTRMDKQSIIINHNLRLLIKKVQKTNKELLKSYEEGNYDLMKVQLNPVLSEHYKKCIKSIKFVKEFDRRLNALIIQDKTLKKYYHEITLTQ